MKQLLKQPLHATVAAVAIIWFLLGCAHLATAQTKYKTVRTDYYRDGALRATTIKAKEGYFKATGETFTIDANKYTVLKHEPVTKPEKGVYIKTVILVYKPNAGNYRVMDATLVYRGNKNRLSEVQIQKNKGTSVIYYLE